jgi:transcriptional regulator with XRE-family HTH domain
MPDIERPSAMTIRVDTARHAIAGEVRAEMARQNKTLRDVADSLGVDHTYLHRRVKGEVSFRADELVVIAQILGVHADQWLRTAAAIVAVAA